MNLWKDCLSCKSKCCGWTSELDFPVFVTKEESLRIKKVGFDISKVNGPPPCMFFNKNNKKCNIYAIRPVDCQLFPFDIHKIKGKFYWVIWKIPCTITNKKNKEKYLKFFEKNIIPNFKKYLEEYNSLECDKLINKYDFEILREVKL